LAVSATSSTAVPGVHFEKRKRLLPIGVRATSLRPISPGSMPANWCAGMIDMWYTAWKNCSGSRRANQNTAVLESGAVTESMSARFSACGEPTSGWVYAL
jgi:hypothetical protein